MKKDILKVQFSYKIYRHRKPINFFHNHCKFEINYYQTKEHNINNNNYIKKFTILYRYTLPITLNFLNTIKYSTKSILLL